MRSDPALKPEELEYQRQTLATRTFDNSLERNSTALGMATQALEQSMENVQESHRIMRF